MSVRRTDRTFLKKHVFSISPSGKFLSVRRTYRPSWKIHVCSTNRWTLLENSCLFDEQILLENYKKVAPGKKEQIFSISVAASDYLPLWKKWLSLAAIFPLLTLILPAGFYKDD